ncbi:hypothetical protein [Capnocytophaga bilenii]|jgi:hypothetical protein
MNIANYREYCFGYYKSTHEEIDGLKLGDVVITDYDHQGQYNPQIGIIIQIRKFDDVNYKYIRKFDDVNDDEYIRIDIGGMYSSKSLRLATDEEIQQYRPNILTENWNKIRAQKWRVIEKEIQNISCKMKKSRPNKNTIEEEKYTQKQLLENNLTNY